MKTDEYKEKYDILYGSYVTVKQERDMYKDKLDKLQQDYDAIYIKYTADEMFISYVKAEYLKAILYILDAEYILKQQGIEFYYVGDRVLEEQ